MLALLLSYRIKYKKITTPLKYACSHATVQQVICMQSHRVIAILRKITNDKVGAEPRMAPTWLCPCIPGDKEEPCWHVQVVEGWHGGSPK